MQSVQEGKGIVRPKIIFLCFLRSQSHPLHSLPASTLFAESTWENCINLMKEKCKVCTRYTTSFGRMQMIGKYKYIYIYAVQIHIHIYMLFTSKAEARRYFKYTTWRL